MGQPVSSKFAPMAAPGASPAVTASRPLSTPPTAPLTTKRPIVEPRKVTTTVLKGPHGIGLDIAKGPDGRTVVKQFKELPPGVLNPAMQCNPQIMPGDIIAEVNGIACASFMDAVKIIKGSGEMVQLVLERLSV